MLICLKCPQKAQMMATISNFTNFCVKWAILSAIIPYWEGSR